MGGIVGFMIPREPKCDGHCEEAMLRRKNNQNSRLMAKNAYLGGFRLGASLCTTKQSDAEILQKVDEVFKSIDIQTEPQ